MLTVILLTVALLTMTILTTNAYAVGDDDLKIEYDGETKIISNIQNYLTSTKNRTFSDKRQAILQSANLNLPMSNKEILNSISKSEKIYYTVYGQPQKSSNDKNYSNVFDDGYINFAFAIFDKGISENGLHLFRFVTAALWRDHYPYNRYKDSICFAWTGGNAMGMGSDYTAYDFIYMKKNYLTNNEEYFDGADRVSEQSIFPYFGLIYDLPADTIAPNFLYCKFCMTAMTTISADDDFLAVATYGHQVKMIGSPTATVNANGLSVNISFDKSCEVYPAPQIRVVI